MVAQGDFLKRIRFEGRARETEVRAKAQGGGSLMLYLH
jgi:hypothetical protein